MDTWDSLTLLTWNDLLTSTNDKTEGMSIALCTEKVLQIGNQYSIKGILIDTLKNADNLNKINNYIDTCQKELATIRKIERIVHYTMEPIVVTVDNTLCPPKVEYTSLALPINFMKLKLIRVNNVPVSDYFIENFELFINSSFVGDVKVDYFAYPTTITKDTPSTTLLDLDNDVCELIPYYVAGHIFLQNSPSISTMILNEYENKRDRLTNPQDNNTGGVSIENVWGGYNGL